MKPYNVGWNDNPNTPEVPSCVVVLVAAAALVTCALLTAYSGYAQLSDEETHAYALKVQRAWHWSAYSDAARAEIAARVARLIEKNPRGYLARIAGQVYR